jgi:Predicted ester cyclase
VERVADRENCTVDASARAVALLEALWSRGDADPVRALAAPDFRYSLSTEGDALDLEAYLALVAGFRSAFDPIDLIFHRVLAEGDRVMAHFSMTGAHVAPIFGVEPTRRQMWVPAMTFMYFEAGQLTRQVSLTDFLYLQRQLRAAS